MPKIKDREILTTQIQVRVRQSMADEIKVIAEDKGLDPCSLLRMWIHEKLKEEKLKEEKTK